MTHRLNKYTGAFLLTQIGVGKHICKKIYKFLRQRTEVSRYILKFTGCCSNFLHYVTLYSDADPNSYIYYIT